MWPVGRKKVWDRLAAASTHGGDEPGEAQLVHVSVLTTIVSPSTVVSPFTGMRAGFVLVELVERIPTTNDPSDGGEAVSDAYDVVGRFVLGDVVTLRDADGDEITVVARRARIEPALPRRGGTPITRMPPELVPLLQGATGRGVLCYRELTMSAGDKLRLRAVVEPTSSIVADGYRSGTRLTYRARDDLAPVVLEEVFEAPPW